MFNVRLEGMERLRHQLDKLENVAQAKALEGAMVAGALIIANEWKRGTPWKTGNYRRSIHIGGYTELTPDFAEQTVAKDIGKQDAGDGKARIIIGTSLTDPPYPVFLETGTSKMAARPSCYPAVLRKGGAAVKEVREALADIVKEQLR